MLNVKTTAPDGRLRAFVHSYVQRESRAGSDELVEPVVARLGSILEFQFADPYDVQFYGLDLAISSAPITIIGPITERRARIVIRGHVEALSVLFQPLGLHSLFGVPVSPLADLGIEGHSIIGQRVSELYQRLGNAKSFGERTQLLNHFLVNRLESVRMMDAAGKALTQLTLRNPRMNVADAAHHAGLSSRQLERRSLQYVGMSPRMILRVARFQRAIRMKFDGAASWTDVAYAAEYHDQTHMIRDFRALAGESPVRALKLTESHHLSHLGLVHVNGLQEKHS